MLTIVVKMVFCGGSLKSIIGSVRFNYWGRLCILEREKIEIVKLKIFIPRNDKNMLF